MIEIAFGPKWFYLVSIFIDLITIFVLFSIATVAARYYKLNFNKNYMKLSFAFYLIAASFLFKMITNITVYYDSLKAAVGPSTITQTLELVRSFNMLAISSFLIFVLANLGGLYVLYSIKRGQKLSTVFLTIYFIVVLSVVSAVFSSSLYYIFHLTSMLFLIFIASRYFNIYEKTRNKNNEYLAYGFSIIAISQAFFMFIVLNPLVYVIAELVQVVGYILLLQVLIRTLYNGRKKKPA